MPKWVKTDFLIWAIPVIPLAALVTWCLWPRISFTLELSLLKAGEIGPPTHRGRCPSQFSLNTFDDEVESQTIADLYYLAGRRLDDLCGSQGRRTYLWHDRLGYPGVSSVVQYPSGYVEVGVFQSNDSDNVWVRVAPGAFSVGDGRGLHELPNFQLPPGTLRCQ